MFRRGCKNAFAEEKNRRQDDHREQHDGKRQQGTALFTASARARRHDQRQYRIRSTVAVMFGLAQGIEDQGQGYPLTLRRGPLFDGEAVFRRMMVWVPTMASGTRWLLA